MRIWRICRKAHAADPMGGRGGLFTSGRWHTRGRRVIYASSSLALAALETLVHVDRAELPPDLVQIELDVPDVLEIERIDRAALPQGWRHYPAPEVLQHLGDEWLERQSTLVLRVPSAVIPEEDNCLVNPAHAAAGKLAVISTRSFVYDARLAP